MVSTIQSRAVIQHKAPRGVAQFLQRKGRAGRKRGMRPWTIVSLSDYARDKFAYQSFEHLFDPELHRQLPTSSRYIKRMQIVYATMDYLSLQLPSHQKGSIWTNFWRPSSSQDKVQLARKGTIQNVIKGILLDADHRSKFTEYLSKALQLNIDEVEMLCWEQPRPLFLEVFPTILRRLEKNWETVNKSNRELPVINAPLPEFIPASFFKDLEQADVKISIREGNRTQSNDWSMNLPQMLREFAPFRVSKRYAMWSQSERYWLPAQLNDHGEYVRTEIHLILFKRSVVGFRWRTRSSHACVNLRSCYSMSPTPMLPILLMLSQFGITTSRKNFGDEVTCPKNCGQNLFQKLRFMHTSGAQLRPEVSIGSEAQLSARTVVLLLHVLGLNTTNNQQL